MKKIFSLAILVFVTSSALGCTGMTFPPHIFKGPPYTMLRHDGEIGRDQLMNRLLVAKNALQITGLEPNQVLSILGQPQDIQVVDRNISEDWIYVYYKKYTPREYSNESQFMVRLYRDHVIDVIRDL